MTIFKNAHTFKKNCSWQYLKMFMKCKKDCAFNLWKMFVTYECFSPCMKKMFTVYLQNVCRIIKNCSTYIGK